MKRPIDRIRRDFEIEFKESGYAASEISNAAPSGIRSDAEFIKRYALKNNLGIDLESTGIDLKRSNVRYLIPESNLEALMKGMKVYATFKRNSIIQS